MKKQRAFTLTELLVVVVIIGVLSAVVLPKFTKVLETRKTTEAEAMLMAVRGEQEARCALDRPYIQEAQKTELASLPSNTGSNYTYTLTGSGITAESQDKNKNYALKIESYQDGSICCSGTYCASLSKKYPACTGVSTDTTGCGVAEVNPEPGPEPEPELTCEEKAGTKPDDRQDPCACGEPRQITYVCENDSWKEKVIRDCDECPSCDITQPTIADNKELCEDMGYSGTGYDGTWNMEKCACDCNSPSSWQDGQGCVFDCDESGRQDCEQGGQAQVEWAHWTAGTWKTVSGTCPECVCPSGYSYVKGAGCIMGCTDAESADQQDCEEGGQSDRAQRGSWNALSCRCDCPAGTAFVAGEGCVSTACMGGNYDQARETCERGGHVAVGQLLAPGITDSRVVAGTWNETTCECDCPPNAYKDKEGACVYSACYDNRDYEQAIEYCENKSWIPSCEGLLSFYRDHEHTHYFTDAGYVPRSSLNSAIYYAQSHWSYVTCDCICVTGSWWRGCCMTGGNADGLERDYDDDFWEGVYPEFGSIEAWGSDGWDGDNDWSDDGVFEFDRD